MPRAIFPFEEIAAEELAIERDAITSVAFDLNVILGGRVRVATGELRASILDNWENGMTGGNFRPPPGMQMYPIPSGDSIRRAGAVHQPGEGMSTHSNVPHSFWLEMDQTLEQAAAEIGEGDPLA